VLHWAGIEPSIADLHAVFRKHFALVDGIVGMEGDGPIQGVPKRVGVLVAGRDLAAVDATCCRIMRIDPTKMGYLRLAAEGDSHIMENNITQAGEKIESVATAFDLLPEFQRLRLEAA
jgi:uncharacterized protein (DUF362 family)